jgi:crotonobetainyl-CoA:carnitine CoA-transferase CaiB-like acyl-CoA transferase
MMHILSNVAVVQIGDSPASRYCTKLLGQFGADVTVIGAPDDSAAQAGGEASWARREAMRIYLDADKSERRRDLAEVVATADVVVRDKDADVFGLTADEEFAQLKASNPAAIYVVLSPFGADGPWAGRSGDDLAMQAAGGLAAQIGRSGEKPLSVPYEIIGLTQGLHAANAVLFCLLLPEQARPTAPVDIAGSDAIASYSRMYTHIYTFYGWPAVRTGARAPGSGGQYPMTILPCRDGHVVLMSRSRAEWARYLEMMGHPSWAQDPELRDPAVIARHHADRVDTYVTEWLSTRTSSELTVLARQYGVPLAPLRAVPEVLTDGQLAYRHFFAAAPDRPDIALPTFPALFTPSSGRDDHGDPHDR